MTVPAVSQDPENPFDFDASALIFEMAGARLRKLRDEANDLAALRRILIAQMAQRDGSPLCCTASFVDVGELQ